MKKNKKTVMSIVAIAIIGLATLIIYSCQKERKFKMYDDDENQASQKIVAAKTASTAVAYPCPCAGVPSGGCPTFKACAKKILGSATSRNFTISWTSCTGCGPTLPPNSTGKVCYTGTCGELYVQIDNVPPCQQNCFGDKACILSKNIVCNGSSFSIQFISEDGTQTVNITGDPFIQLDCAPIGGPFSHCEGNLTWN